MPGFHGKLQHMYEDHQRTSAEDHDPSRQTQDRGAAVSGSAQRSRQSELDIE